jgi:hypothetical protein
MDRLFLACTPRTGNVWFRKMLAKSLGIAEVAQHTPAQIAWEQLDSQCLVAMHWEYSQAFLDFLGSQHFVPIVTVRHPLDVLVSILQFSQHEPATAMWLEGRCGDEGSLRDADPASPEFLQYGLSQRAAALLSVSVGWLPVARAVIRYEDLVADTEGTLLRVLDALGESPRVSLEEVKGAFTLGRLREFSKHHFWRGIPGLWREVVPVSYREAIFQRHRQVFEALGYDCECATGPTPEAARQRWRAICDDGDAAAVPTAAG